MIYFLVEYYSLQWMYYFFLMVIWSVIKLFIIFPAIY